MFRARQTDVTEELWHKARLSVIQRHLFVLIGLGILAFALLLLAYAAPLDSFSQYLIRDIGLAIVVSIVIVGLYEVHARDQFDIRLINRTIDLVLSDLSRKDIWREVQRQVIEKRAIRERLHISIKILRAEDLSTAEDPIELDSGQMVLSMHLEYDLYGLRSLPSSVNILHHLNKYLKAKTGRLPRFEFIYINGGPNLKSEVNAHDEFNKEITVDPKDNKPIHVSLCKKEVIHIPGAHCLTLAELTKGIELTLLGAPRDVEVFFSLRPHAEDQSLVENPPQAIRFDDEIMLPGQTIEFLFKRKEVVPSLSKLKGPSTDQTTPDLQLDTPAFTSAGAE